MKRDREAGGCGEGVSGYQSHHQDQMPGGPHTKAAVQESGQGL